MERPRGSRAPNSILRRRRGGHRIARTRGPALPAKEKKRWRTERRPPPSPNRRRTAPASRTSVFRSAEEVAAAQSKRCEELRLSLDHARRPDTRSTSDLKDDEPRAHPSLVADARGN
jgi:hypothetical protein